MTSDQPLPDRPAPDRTTRPVPSPAPVSGDAASQARPSGGAVHAVFRRALRDMLVLVAVVAVLGVGIGYAVEGVPGVWGALIGAGVALVFSGTTVLSMLRTADASATTTGAVILGAWLVKMLLLVVLFAVLDDLTFYDREVLVAVVLAGVLGSVYLDYRAVRTGRVPYVEPVADRDS